MYTTRFFCPGDSLGDAFAVRTAVFVKEQEFSQEAEFDEIDPIAWHVVLYDANIPVATGRLFPRENSNKVFVIGRIAVLPEYRGQKLGEMVMERLESRAIELGAEEVDLGAQCQAAGFYQKLGYHMYGEHYYDEHCEHVHMHKQL